MGFNQTFHADCLIYKYVAVVLKNCIIISVYQVYLQILGVTWTLKQYSHSHENSWILKVLFPGLEKSLILRKMAKTTEESWDFIS